jgi:hypothetical protein
MNKIVKHTLTAFDFVISALWTAPHGIAQTVAIWSLLDSIPKGGRIK